MSVQHNFGPKGCPLQFWFLATIQSLLLVARNCLLLKKTSHPGSKSRSNCGYTHCGDSRPWPSLDGERPRNMMTQASFQVGPDSSEVCARVSTTYLASAPPPPPGAPNLALRLLTETQQCEDLQCRLFSAGQWFRGPILSFTS